MIEGDVFRLITQYCILLFIFIKSYKYEDVIRDIIYMIQKSTALIVVILNKQF